MLLEIAIGLGLMCLTIVIHASFMVSGVKLAEWRISRRGTRTSDLQKAVLISLFTAWLFTGVTVEALLWAAVYLHIPSITTLADLESAFYFSMVTFTTVGYGDVVLTGSWRMLSSLQAGNGVIIFGWTTALIFYFIQKIYGK